MDWRRRTHRRPYAQVQGTKQKQSVNGAAKTLAFCAATANRCTAVNQQDRQRHPNTCLHPCCIATPLGKRTATRHPVLSKRLLRTQHRHNTPVEQHSHTPNVRLLRTDAPQSTNRIGSRAKQVHRCHPTMSKHQHSRTAGTRSHETTGTWKKQTEGKHRACN